MADQPNPKESLQTLHSLLTEASLVIGTIKSPSTPRAAELLATALAVTRDMMEHAETNTAASLGRKGGSKTAERGAEYFKQIASLRKTKAGGRPKRTL
jgi:hypothetical protein